MPHMFLFIFRLLIICSLLKCCLLVSLDEEAALGEQQQQQQRQPASRDDDLIHIVYSVSFHHYPGLFASLNSAYRNSRQRERLRFHLVIEPVEEDELRYQFDCFRDWLRENGMPRPPRDAVHFVHFNASIIWNWDATKDRDDLVWQERLRSPHNFIRFYFPQVLSSLWKIIFIDADTIIQGDLCELYDMSLPREDRLHVVAAARPSGLYLESKAFGQQTERTFSTYMDMEQPAFQKWIEILQERRRAQSPPLDEETELAVEAMANSPAFNAGVFVARLDLWREYDLTADFEWWLMRKAEEPYLYNLGTQPPLMLASYARLQWLPASWNIMIAKKCQFIDESRRSYWEDKMGCKRVEGPDLIGDRARSANILHWSTHLKPWLTGSASDFMQFYLPYEINWSRCWHTRHTKCFNPRVFLDEKVSEYERLVKMYDFMHGRCISELETYRAWATKLEYTLILLLVAVVLLVFLLKCSRSRRDTRTCCCWPFSRSVTKPINATL